MGFMMVFAVALAAVEVAAVVEMVEVMVGALEVGVQVAAV
jgi:hypothetical protein